MGTKPYTLFKRGDIWYCRFRDIDGERATPKSTGETARARAEQWAVSYLQKGQGRIVKSELVTLDGFSRGFFDWSSPWATDKKARGMRISENHCLQRADLLKNHIIPALGKMRVSSINRAVIKDFRNKLFEAGYSGNTINKCLSALKSILEAAEERGLIQYVPRIDRAAENPKVKGILTPDEVRRLFSFQWMSKPSRNHPAKPLFVEQAGNLLAVTTGLRLSEIQGLFVGDVSFPDNYITVRRSWDNRLLQINEATKTGRERIVFFPGTVKAALLELVDANPYKSNPNSFLFFGDTQDKPKDRRGFTVSLASALEQIGISRESQRARVLSFHGHRHFLNSLLINSRVPLQKLQSIVGYTTMNMTEHYYRPDDMQDVLQITEGIFKEAL